jgi:uncharacterized protein YggU (UPF0235/DUF167 family)
MVRISVRVHPRASRNAVRADGAGGAEVWTTAPPADGKANEAVRRLLAEWLHVPPTEVRIVAGVASRTKIVEVEGLAHPPPRA